MNRARFEIVESTSDQPWFARVKAGNNLETFRTSENYERDRGVRSTVVDHCIEILRALDPDVNYRVDEDGLWVWRSGMDVSTAGLIRIVDVDERGPKIVNTP